MNMELTKQLAAPAEGAGTGTTISKALKLSRLGVCRTYDAANIRARLKPDMNGALISETRHIQIGSEDSSEIALRTHLTKQPIGAVLRHTLICGRRDPDTITII